MYFSRTPLDCDSLERFQLKVNNLTELLVITPVYNGEKYIEASIKSVLKARVPSMTYLVVNDGSTDGTAEILKKYLGEIVVIEQANHGEGSAVNVGFLARESKYVMVVSSDDLVDENIFRRLIQVLEENPEISVAYPDWEMINDEGDVISRIETPEFSIYSLIEKMICIPGPGALIRRSSLNRDYLRDASYVYVGDFECWLHLARSTNFIRVPEYLAKWRMHGTNMSIKGRNELMAEERIRVYKQLLALTQNQKPLKNLVQKGLGTAYFSSAKLVYFDSKIPAKKYLIKSLYWNFFLRRDIYAIGYIFSSKYLRKRLTPILNSWLQRN
jgi:glycosyltransferase involved in cell wall biosynthesis